MTNEEKAREIGAKHGIGDNGFDSDIIDAIKEMAEWKDQQFNKVCDWLRETNIDGLSDSKNLTSYFINKLREIYNN